MAERRMFAKTIIDSDAFLNMPLSAQALYFHLSMRADDDGFINNAKKIQRMIGGNDDDYNLLIAKNFVLVFNSGVIVIKHWRMHNYIRKDRYRETVYTDEKACLSLKDNGSYSLGEGGIPLVDHLATQVRLGKDRIGKVSIGKDREKEEEKEIEPLNPLEAVLNNFADENLIEPLREFIKHRELMERPLTSQSLKYLIQDLKNLSNGDIETAKEIIKQSIMNGWLRLVPLKDNKNKKDTNNPFLRMLEEEEYE